MKEKNSIDCQIKLNENDWIFDKGVKMRNQRKISSCKYVIILQNVTMFNFSQSMRFEQNSKTTLYNHLKQQLVNKIN